MQFNKYGYANVVGKKKNICYLSNDNKDNIKVS